MRRHGPTSLALASVFLCNCIPSFFLCLTFLHPKRPCRRPMTTLPRVGRRLSYKKGGRIHFFFPSHSHRPHLGDATFSSSKLFTPLPSRRVVTSSSYSFTSFTSLFYSPGYIVYISASRPLSPLHALPSSLLGELTPCSSARQLSLPLRSLHSRLLGAWTSLSTSRRANFLLLFIHSTFTHSTTPRFLVFTQSSSSLSPLLSSAILLLPPLALFVSSFTSPVSSWRLDLLLLPLLHILRPRLLGTTFSSSAALMLVFPGISTEN